MVRPLAQWIVLPFVGRTSDSNSDVIAVLTRGAAAGMLIFMRMLMGTLMALVAPLGAWAADVAPNFKLPDVNPNSVRRAALVSPRDYLLQVSGYYFGEAG
jgi:hypothetical protein